MAQHIVFMTGDGAAVPGWLKTMGVMCTGMPYSNSGYIVNHLFLPPNLPQEYDSRDLSLPQCDEPSTATLLNTPRGHRKHDALLSHVIESAGEFIKPSSRLYKIWRSKNARIILRKLEVEITLEIFQASATAAHVTRNGGKLLIQYPSRPRLSILNNPLLIKSLSAYLATMDCTEMPEAMPTTRKAQSEQKESREVPDIRCVRAVRRDYKSLNPRCQCHGVQHCTSLLERKIDGRYGYKAVTTYVLARALEKASEAKLDHHLLWTMNVKIATRIWKLKSLDHTGFPFKYIWRRVQELEASPLPWTVPTSEEIHAAEGFALARSGGYLSAVYNRRSELEQRSSCFNPEAFEATFANNNLRETGLSPPARITTGSAGSELWLAVLDTTTPVDTRLEVLGQMISSFDIIAISLDNPEQFSRVDEMAVEAIPLLRNIHPLLLPTLCQMRRIRAVETHLSRRHADAVYHRHSLFEFIHHRDSFGARYFRSDLGLQNLRREIEQEAAALRAEKQQDHLVYGVISLIGWPEHINLPALLTTGKVTDPAPF
ncbi:hypothetical protein JB92DRAFT_3091865 [Gautieria morchelliformis]|nr:hypothetical protein JB92DRAFT_3091865 [Gautieria morchelliformis]